MRRAARQNTQRPVRHPGDARPETYPVRMSSLRTPVGPQPPSVYWRRRLLVGLGLLAVIVVIVLIVVRPGSGDPASAPTPTPSAVAPDAATEEEPTETEEETPAPEGECDPSVIQLAPVTDAASYAPGVAPKISMSITNTSAAACTYDVGTGAQEYIISSGADRIWSSRDCQTEPAETLRELAPGEVLSTTPFDWDRTRSSADTCEGERPAVTGGGATYRLAVALGAATSTEDKPFLLE